MQYVIGGIFTGIAQACCWYQVFRCCGCIEDTRPQGPTVVVTQAKTQNSGPNPFLSPEAMRQWDMGSYSHGR